MRFYNTLGRNMQDFQPIEEKVAKMYTCGPTVYNYAHIGNFRAYLFEDLLRRSLEYHGYKVTQVMNLTDVDDKTIRDSRAAGLKLQDFTRKYKDAFFEDLRTLRIEPAEHYPEATTHIPEMIEMIRILFEKGFAYKSEDGSVYFSIAKFKDYGKLAKELEIGEPTLRDIVKELEKPARDPRDEMPKPILRTDVLDMKDLKEGMVLKGTVRNVIDFGAFVDIGVHQDGLVHISEMSEKFIKHPLEAVSVGDIVDVRVLGVDMKKKRISLSMKGINK